MAVIEAFTLPQIPRGASFYHLAFVHFCFAKMLASYINALFVFKLQMPCLVRMKLLLILCAAGKNSFELYYSKNVE